MYDNSLSELIRVFSSFRNDSHDFVDQELLLGTHTSGSEQNYLMIANVHLPLPETEIDIRNYDEENGGMQCICSSMTLESGGFSGVSGKINISIKINHEGEVNKYFSL